MIYWWKTVTFLLELLHCFWCNFRQRTWLIILRVTTSACAVLHCLCRGMGLCWQGVKSAGTQTHRCSNLVTVERFCQSAAKPLPYKWLSQPAAAPGFGVRGTTCWGESCCIQTLSLESLQADQGFLYPSYLNKWRHHLFCVSFLFYFVFILCFEFFSFSHKEPNQTLPYCSGRAAINTSQCLCCWSSLKNLVWYLLSARDTGIFCLFSITW